MEVCADHNHYDSHGHNLLSTVQIAEFSKSIDTSKFQFQSDGVLVIWEWEWIVNVYEHEGNGDSSEGFLSENSDEDESSPCSDIEADRSQIVQPPHTVTFKVIGCTKERAYQDTT